MVAVRSRNPFSTDKIDRPRSAQSTKEACNPVDQTLPHGVLEVQGESICLEHWRDRFILVLFQKPVFRDHIG